MLFSCRFMSSSFPQIARYYNLFFIIIIHWHICWVCLLVVPSSADQMPPPMQAPPSHSLWVSSLHAQSSPCLPSAHLVANVAKAAVTEMVPGMLMVALLFSRKPNPKMGHLRYPVTASCHFMDLKVAWISSPIKHVIYSAWQFQKRLEWMPYCSKAFCCSSVHSWGAVT